MYNSIRTLGNYTFFPITMIHMRVQNIISALMKTDVWFFLSSFFIPYHLHFKEDQLQHTTNILFLAENPRK